MPFAPLFYPSIALSLLKSGLGERGVSSQVLYLNLDYAQRIGLELYRRAGESSNPSRTDLVGEWMFARELFLQTQGDDQRYVDNVLRAGHGGYRRARSVSVSLCERFLAQRESASEFLDHCLERVLGLRPTVVGFTSVFQQHAASLAMARRIKERSPETFTVLGGANCEGIMGKETARQFPFVDAVVSGEGDEVFPELVERVRESKSLAGLPGVMLPGRPEDTECAATAPLVRDLDRLPIPDYADFFEQFAASRFDRDWQPGVFFESSRGCWWGERNHCTFCGLNGNGLAYRSKSPTRVLAELDALARRHPNSDILVVDNILDMRYFEDVIPALARRAHRLELFYETKANLKKTQVRMLREAGILEIQPGIESLSDPVLRLMRKGVSTTQNIQLLKWCAEYGVETIWNMLWGFPGEDARCYEEMAELIPLLAHLPPPRHMGPIRLDRFSPLFRDAAELGLKDVAPYPSYRYVYPLPPENVRNLAYYFTFRYQRHQDPDRYVGKLKRRIREWQKRHGLAALFYVDVGERLWIWDLRPMAKQPLHVIGGAQREIYLACDEATSIRKLASTSPPTTEGLIHPLVEAGLLLRLNGKVLSLATALTEFTPSPDALRHFHHVARRLGRRTTDGDIAVSEDAFGCPPKPSARPIFRSRNGKRERRAHFDFKVNGRGELVIRSEPRRREGGR